MQYTPHDMSEFLKGPDARRVCTLVAAYRMARARNLVGQDTGETARSGHLVHGYGGKKNDRVKVSIVFGGKALARQFGNARSRPDRFLTRALEG